MSTYALIGWPLGHSFSKKYFTEKFFREGILDAQYELFPLENIADFPTVLEKFPDLKGLNVTIPHKESVIPFLHELDETAHAVGAVNCIKIDQNHRLKGYNTDVTGFEQSFKGHQAFDSKKPAFILGTGGAAKAVAFVLQKLQIQYLFVSRNPCRANEISYDALSAHCKPYSAFHLINSTPLGTFPKLAEMPPIPIEILKPGILVFDLVYNPAETLLLQEARARGCVVQNGLEMLHLQAEAAWEIWQT